jgi:lipoprotein-anchoring transpeptidase ErfK/SrfK
MRLTRPVSRGVVAAIAGVVLLGGGGAVVAATQLGGDEASGSPVVGDEPGARPGLKVAGLEHGKVPWNHKVTVRARNASLESVTLRDKDGTLVNGIRSADGTRWRSADRLVPKTKYVGQVALIGADGETVSKRVRFRATDTDKHLTALLSPGDDDVVGVGSPVIVRLSRPVPESQRAAVQERLAVSTTPDVVGAWHWMSDQELHWRPPTYWKPHTVVTVSSHFGGLNVGHGVWGAGDHRSTFRIGDSHISRVDVARHEMYVYENRKLIKTFPISAGKDEFPTKNGVHITFEKSEVVTMDSATVGIPRDSLEGYYEKVYWDVRISYGGAFVHAAPWSVASQGIANVSHGCVNLSTENAQWFYGWSLRGDVVDVYNSGAAVDTADPGMADWNMSWKDWVAGDASPTGAALHTKAPLPHDAEPPAPAPARTTTATSEPSSSPSPSPSATHRQRNRDRDRDN